jgi:hypothetical protein
VSYLKQTQLTHFAGFCIVVADDSVLLVHGAASLVNLFPTFRDNVMASSSSVEIMNSKFLLVI